jgi:hypothetical protein
MRRAANRFVAGIALASGIALAQDHPTAQLRDCSPTERAEGLESSREGAADRRASSGEQSKQLDH